jgi:methylated-DNA-[protein]-cysteine S-methyltransferase
MREQKKKELWDLLKKIPKGEVTTYSILARKLETSPRAIGATLKTNPRPNKTPCFKVVLSSGELGGYVLGKKKKKRLLEGEGVTFKDSKIKDFEQKTHDFT